MMNWIRNLIALGAAVATCSAARSAEVVKRFDVSLLFPGSPIPVVAGSFTVQFDLDLDYTKTTSGVIAYSVNVPLDSAPSFTKVGRDFFVFGGFSGGPYVIDPNSGDFSLSMPFPVNDGLQTFYASKFSTAGQAYATDAGTVRVTTLVAGVPEPATWTLMIGGFGIVGGTLRSRRRRTRQAPIKPGAA